MTDADTDVRAGSAPGDGRRRSTGQRAGRDEPATTSASSGTTGPRCPVER